MMSALLYKVQKTGKFIPSIGKKFTAARKSSAKQTDPGFGRKGRVVGRIPGSLHRKARSGIAIHQSLPATSA